MRAFIGIKMKDCLDQILNIQDQYKNQNINGNYTLPNNIHITLSFLGEITISQIDKVKEILDTINFNKFSLTISKIKNLKDMVILEIEENKDLIYLQKYIEKKLVDNGFNIEKRKFYPHVTLIRKVNIDINQDILIRTNIDECILFSSERINDILTYTPLYRKSLR